MEKELNIEKLKDVKFTFSKDAFEVQEMQCEQCKKNMENSIIDFHIPKSSISVKLQTFHCTTCNKEYLNFQEAKKLDKTLLIARLLDVDSFKMRKSLSFDGGNYIFRIPAEIARNFGKKPYAEVTPLSSQDLLIHINKS